MGHHVFGGTVVKLKDVVDHFPLALGNQTFFIAHIHHFPNILFGALLRICIGVNAHQPQYAIGNQAAKSTQRRHQLQRYGGAASGLVGVAPG